MANRFIQKLRGFAELTSTEVEALEAATRSPATVGARRDLIREGDQPGSVFVILDGWAFRYKVLPSGARQVMAFPMPGDACDLHIGLLERDEISRNLWGDSREGFDLIHWLGWSGGPS